MSAPPCPLPFTLGQLAIAAWDAAQSDAFVAAELEAETYRWPEGSYEARIAKGSREHSLRQNVKLNALHVMLRAMSRHEASFMPLIAVALAAEGIAPSPSPHQEDAAHERA